MLHCSYNLPIMLKNKNRAQSIITICIQICINKSLFIADNIETVLLGCIYKCQQNTLYVFIGNDCSIRIYQSFVASFQKYFLLCWHYA